MRLLLAVDLKRQGVETTVDAAGAWAARLGATLDLVYADQFGGWRPTRSLDRSLNQLLESELERDREALNKRLSALLDRIPPAHRGEAHLRAGDPRDVIPVDAGGYDALVLGHGERLSDHLGVASFIAELVRSAPSTVLVLPKP